MKSKWGGDWGGDRCHADSVARDRSGCQRSTRPGSKAPGCAEIACFCRGFGPREAARGPLKRTRAPRATFGLSRGICCEWPTRAVGVRGPGIGDLPDQLRGDDSDLLSCRDVHLGAHVGAYPAPGKRGSLALAATCSGSSKALCAAGWLPSSASKTTLSLVSQSTRPVAVQAVTKS